MTRRPHAHYLDGTEPDPEDFLMQVEVPSSPESATRGDIVVTVLEVGVDEWAGVWRLETDEWDGEWRRRTRLGSLRGTRAELVERLACNRSRVIVSERSLIGHERASAYQAFEQRRRPARESGFSDPRMPRPRGGAVAVPVPQGGHRLPPRLHPQLRRAAFVHSALRQSAPWKAAGAVLRRPGRRLRNLRTRALRPRRRRSG